MRPLSKHLRESVLALVMFVGVLGSILSSSSKLKGRECLIYCVVAL
jgi:hypothetical protein